MELWALAINKVPDSTNWEQQYRASLAVDIIKHCALVTGTADGEDSAGRSKVAVMPAAEVAARACDIAGSLVDEFERRGWIRDSAVTCEDLAAYEGRLASARYQAEFDDKDAARAARRATTT